MATNCTDEAWLDDGDRKKEKEERLRLRVILAIMRLPGELAPAWTSHAGSCVPKHANTGPESGERSSMVKQLRGTCLLAIL